MADEKQEEKRDEATEEISLEGLAEEAEDYMSDPLAETDELEALRAERDEFRDRFMRALADAENSRKRGERDRREAEQYGGSKLARDMLPVYDNLSRALEAATDEQREQAAGLIEGVELTMRELLNVFAKHGITLVKPDVGDKFDPQIHQAMFEAPLPNTAAGDIIQVMAVGFLLHDRLLRPAQVGVSSTPAS
ncbi:nucleotide exchange factor GrpE [Tropicimonas sp. IMCC6043]|uniref:nucleotide exchange factor GrpE n=1 Tax=Tropicimonas sp. IMCC6043 TaxID=2510645 RepID=UPI00101D81A7|nr:nucleotide exchange factor GrpE [Tropicimonas sp. IMCC6043]RYH10861.1 nucleotide exchange factor GrpE [Tropicimonas sp. IMCC6043]